MRRLLLVLLLLAQPAWSVTNTYQEGVGSPPFNAATPDTYLYSLLPTTNDGGGTQLIIGQYFGIARAICEFNISDITAGNTVSTATLTFNIGAIDTSPSIASTLYRLRRSDWAELQATWNVYKTGTNWTTAGAGDTTNDIDTSVTATTTPTGTGTHNITVTTLAQDAIDNRSGIFRVLIRLDTETGADHNWWPDSAEHAVSSSNRPKLAVTFTTGGAAPIPRRLFHTRLPFAPWFQPPLPRLHAATFRLDPQGQTVTRHALP